MAELKPSDLADSQIQVSGMFLNHVKSLGKQPSLAQQKSASAKQWAKNITKQDSPIFLVQKWQTG